MDLELRGRCALVGGASRGIGLAVARAFLAEGANVAMLARGASRLDEAAHQLAHDHPDSMVCHSPVDLRDAVATATAVERVREKLGGIDCVVSCAGSGVGKSGWQAGAEEWNRLLDENLASAVNLCRASIGSIGPGGAIVLIASIAGLRRLRAPMPYAAGKAALIRYGKDLAADLSGRSIRVNTVAPGNVLIAGGRWEELRASDPSGVDEYIRRDVPLGRFGSAEEIAAAVVFLCSVRSSFTTGSCLAVDGGQLGD